MFEYLKGTVISAVGNKLILEVGAIGYRILAPHPFLLKLAPGTLVTIFITQVIREDAHLLFGFSTPEERECFELLTQVSGIGPKTALSALAHLDIGTLADAIESHNTALLSKIPGIGKKTAERLSMELQDKIKHLSLYKHSIGNESKALVSDALGALVQLGYNPAQAQLAIQKIYGQPEKSTSLKLPELIREALRLLQP